MGRITFGGGKVGMKKPSRLPSGYTELAYIESSGTQRIMTGMHGSNKTRAVFDVHVLDTQTTEGHICSAAGTYFFTLFIDPSKTQWYGTRYGSSSVQRFSTTLNAYERVTIDKNRNVTTMDGETLTATDTTFSMTLELPLFCRNANGTFNNYIKARLYSCQFYTDDVLVRDFVPCMSDADGIGLFDLVNNKFYGNAGTGSFVGSEVA